MANLRHLWITLLVLLAFGSSSFGQHRSRSQQATLDMDLLTAAGCFQKNRNGEHADEVAKFLRKGANPNARGPRRETALLGAAAQDYVKTAQIMLRHGAFIEAQDAQGNTALIFAASRGSDVLVKDLIRRGAKVNHKDNEGRTALYYASTKTSYYPAIIRILKRAGAR